MLEELAKYELLILDDLAIGQLTETQRHDVLELLDDRDGHTSTLVTSQLPTAIGMLESAARHSPTRCSTG